MKSLILTRPPRNVLRLLAAGLVALTCLPASAGTCDSPDAPLVYPWTDPTTFAKPKGVVPPDYPAAQFKAGVTAQVEAVLRINERGTLKEVLAIKAGNGDEAFENAVRDVVRFWNFESLSNCECKPVEFTARLTVWFEIKDGKPSISVSRGGDVDDLPGLHAKPLKLVRDAVVFRKISATSPRELRRAGKDAIVYAMLLLKPETGAAESAKIVHVDVDPDYRQYFGATIEEALKQLRYEPFASTQSGLVSSCFVVNFRTN